MMTKKLRKYYRILLAIFLLGGALSCRHREEEAENNPTILRIQPVTQSPHALQTRIDVTVFCNIKWNVDLSDKSWAKIENLSVDEGSGGSFSLVMSPNTGKSSRETVIKVTAGKGETSTTITQGGLDTYLSPSSFSLTGVEQSSISFEAPSSWTAKVSSGEEWIRLKTPSGKAGSSILTISAKDENQNVGSREGAILLTIGSVEMEIPVFQGQKDVILSKDSSVSLGWEGGQFSVLTQSNVDYSIECGADWIEHEGTKSLNEATEVFVVKPNEGSEERSAEVTFTGTDGVKLSVAVTQEGKDPFLGITKEGFYGVNGMDYVFGEGGWNQSGRKTGTDGTLSYRLMNRKELAVISVEGLRISEKGKEMELLVNVKKKDRLIMQSTYWGVVLGQSEEMIWVKSGTTCFIVKK